MGRALDAEPSRAQGALFPDSVAIVSEELPFVGLSLAAWRVGADYVVVASGGAAHVGCAVLAVPRSSLKGDGAASSTASVLNVSGHKDDVVCRAVAERVCAAMNATVACTGGVHVDDISVGQITQISDAFERMTDQLIEKLVCLNCQ